MLSLPALLIGATALFAAQAAPPNAKPKPSSKAVDDASFAAALDRVRKLGDDGKWSVASKSLENLLADTGDLPFVRGRRTEIVAELKRIAVRIAVPLPDPGTLIHGKLANWERKTGEISLVYEPVGTDDFIKCGDFWILPIDFDGPVTIRAEGDEFDGVGKHLLAIAVGVHDEDWTEIALAAGKLTRTEEVTALTEILRTHGQEKDVLFKVEKGPLLGKRFEIEINVGGSEITITYNNVRLGQAKRPAGLRGRVGLVPAPMLKRLTIRGTGSTSWLQGKLDAAVHDAEEKFLADWKPDDHLPKWLASSAAPAAAAPARKRPAPDALPWRMTPPDIAFAEKICALVDGGKGEQAFEEWKKRKPAEFSKDLVDYLALVIVDELHWLAVNAELVDDFLKRHPDFAFARLIHAHCTIALGRFEEAAPELADLRGHVDDEVELATDLVELDLLLERIDDAARALREARAAGVTSNDLTELERDLVSLRRGPDFARRYEQKSDHFLVVTDMDAATPKTAARQLEESYRICSQIFGESKEPARITSAYLFSGRSGYVAYGGTLGSIVHSTAGLYSPTFKQLLVWNLPERDEVARTLRHEATHQYLDRLGFRMPVWLNEGWATYVEQIASSGRADVKAGAVDRARLGGWVANRHQIFPLDELFMMSPQKFYACAALTYVESWGLLHFLRHGKLAVHASDAPTLQQIDQRLLQALRDRAPIPELAKRAFAGVDMPSFQAAFFAHMDELCRAEGVR